MMKPLLILVALLGAFALFAQDLTPIKWGAEFPLARGNESNYRLESSSADGYQLWLEPERAPAALLDFEHTHRVRQTQVLRNLYRIPNLDFQDLIIGKRDTLACFAAYDKELQMQTLFTAPYRNRKLGALRPAFTFAIPEAWSSSPVQSVQDNQFRTSPTLYQSPERTHFVYIKAFRPPGSKSHSVYMVAVFDENGEHQWHRQIDRSSSAEFITGLDVEINDLGEVMILAQLQASRNFALAQGTPHIAGYRMQLFQCTPDTTHDVDIYPEPGIVPLNSRLHLPPGQTDQLMIVGLYQDLTTPLINDGFYIKRIQLGQAIFTAGYYPFSRFTLTNNSGTKSWENRLVLRDYFQLSDGSFGVVAEVAYALTSPGPTSNTAYLSHQVLIPMFNAEGHLQRISTLDKFLMADDYALSSYGLGVGEDQLHFVYNERGQSLRTKVPDLEIKSKGLGTVLQTLNADGSWSKPQVLAVHKDLKHEPLPQGAIFTEDYCFFPAESPKNVSIGTVSLK
ncbi:MAG: hypothetical protein AAFP77_00295 [Bacteroidota bacterium]